MHVCIRVYQALDTINIGGVHPSFHQYLEYPTEVWNNPFLSYFYIPLVVERHMDREQFTDPDCVSRIKMAEKKSSLHLQFQVIQ